MYSDNDMIRLQQICVLKFFGLSLENIKKIFFKKIDQLDHLIMQKKMLLHEVAHLNSIINILEQCIEQGRLNHRISLTKIFKTIEGLHMINDLKKTSLGKILNEVDLQHFAALRQNFSEEQAIAYGKKWDILIEKVEAVLNTDPTTKESIALAKEWMRLVDECYKDTPHLKNTLWQAFKEGKFDSNDIGFPKISKAMTMWIERAVKAGKLY